MQDINHKYNTIYDKYKFENINLEIKTESDIDIFINNLNNLNSKKKIVIKTKKQSIKNKTLFLSNRLYYFLKHYQEKVYNVNLKKQMYYNEILCILRYCSYRTDFYRYYDCEIYKEFYNILNERLKSCSHSKIYTDMCKKFIEKYTTLTPILIIQI